MSFSKTKLGDSVYRLCAHFKMFLAITVHGCASSNRQPRIDLLMPSGAQLLIACAHIDFVPNFVPSSVSDRGHFLLPRSSPQSSFDLQFYSTDSDQRSKSRRGSTPRTPRSSVRMLKAATVRMNASTLRGPRPLMCSVRFTSSQADFDRRVTVCGKP